MKQSSYNGNGMVDNPQQKLFMQHSLIGTGNSIMQSNMSPISPTHQQ
jgi:hypothetical protein